MQMFTTKLPSNWRGKPKCTLRFTQVQKRVDVQLRYLLWHNFGRTRPVPGFKV